MLRSNNIQNSNIDLSGLVYVNPTKVKKKQFLRKGDILVTASTGSIKVIGKNAYCTKDYEASFGAFCKVVRPKNINPSYLKHMFQSPQYFGYIQNIVNGANINNIKNEHLDNFKIPLPPLNTQIHIASILDNAAALRDKTAQLLKEYDLLKRSIFQDMFGNPLENEKGFWFPKLKEVCKVSQGMQIAISKRFDEDGPNRYKYITIAYINGRKKAEFIKNPRLSVVCDTEDILMTRTGNTGSVVTGVHGVFHNNFFKIDWNHTQLNKDYFLAFLSNENIKLELIKRASSTTIPDLNHGQFYDLNIIIPPLHLQNQFAEKIALIEQQKELAKQELKESEDLFNCLLQKAFKGELIQKEEVNA